MTDSLGSERQRAPWRDQSDQVIFGHETRAGRRYDLFLIAFVLLSVLVVLLESVRALREAYGFYFRAAEWFFTSLFTIEYAARLVAAKNAKRYAVSFYGVVDLLAIAPVYLSVFFGLTHSFTVVRSLRLLRVFRILKLTEYTGEAAVLQVALGGDHPLGIVEHVLAGPAERFLKRLGVRRPLHAHRHFRR